MKKILTLLLIVAITTVFAQKPSSLSKTEELPNWPELLTNLNLLQINSGILLDKVTDYANLNNFNTVEKNLSSNQHFEQALNELYKASDQTRFISSNVLKERTAYSTENNSVDVGFINTSFQRLNINEDDILLSGLNQLNGKYVAVAGKPSFISKKIFVASPLKSLVTGSSINFNFNNTFTFTNATTALKTITVKFQENTANAPVTVFSNGNFTLDTKNIVYTTTGVKVLAFTATFSDNSVITTFAQIDVVAQNAAGLRLGVPTLCNENKRDQGIFTSNLPFKGYETNDLTINGKIEYTVFYSNNNSAKKMLKPIILVDGFDPGDTRKVKDCDCEQDDDCRNLDKYNDIVTIWSGGSPYTVGSYPNIIKTFNPIKHISIYDSTEYLGLNPAGDQTKIYFIDELRTLGYDVIVVNNPSYEVLNYNAPTTQVFVPRPFPGHFETRPNMIKIDGGADYIERNAMTLVSFMQQYVKTGQNAAGSTERLVLIGPSMGGQITRFALAYMEKKFAETNLPIWKHNARLWVSVDSPHLGANIPVGAQANVWFLADETALSKLEAQASYRDLNSVAAVQQSIVNFEYSRITPAHNLLGSPYFTTYYNRLNTNGVAGSLGYPVSIPGTFRKIALTNGSLAGVKQGSESQVFLDSRVFIRGLWPFQSSSITLARFRDSFTPGYGGYSEVFKGDGQNLKAGLANWRINHPRITIFMSNQDIRGSLDIAPGGYFLLGKTLKESIEGGANKDGYRSETGSNYFESNSFISTFSALGHLQPNQNWSNPLNRNLTCPSNQETPFDSYFGKSTNTEHTSFSKESAEWLKKELAGNPQAPYFPVQPNQLTGDNTICENVAKTYQFLDLCKIPGKATFTVVGNLAIDSFTDYSVTVHGTTGGGSVKIIADFGNGVTYEKVIWIGIPQFKNFTFKSSVASVCIAAANNFQYSIPELNTSDSVVATFDGLSTAETSLNSNWQWTTQNDLILLNGTKNKRAICTLSAGSTSC